MAAAGPSPDPSSKGPPSAKPSPPAIQSKPASSPGGSDAKASTPANAPRKPPSKTRHAGIIAAVATVALVSLAVVGAALLLKDDSDTTITNNTTTAPGRTETVVVTETQTGATTTSSAQTTTEEESSPIIDPDEDVDLNNRLPELDLVAPVDGATDVPLNQVLEWDASDADGDELTFDVYWGLAPNPTSVLAACDGISTTTCTPPSLDYSTSYYWRVVAHDGNGGTLESDEWSFTTAAEGGGDVCPPGTIQVEGRCI